MNKSIILILSLISLIGCEKETINGTILTLEVSDITTSSAICSGYVKLDNAGDYGYFQMSGAVWNTIPNILPTIESDRHKESGGAVGNISIEMTNLSANTTYYVRVYAKIRNVVIYGETLEFKTN